MVIRRGKLVRSRREPEGKSHALVLKLVCLVQSQFTVLDKTKISTTNRVVSPMTFTKNRSSDQVNREEPQHIEVPPHFDILDFSNRNSQNLNFGLVEKREPMSRI